MQDRMSRIEEQVDGLIDLVLDGVDATDLIENVYDEIHEDGNGPFPIGSKVKINTSWSGQTVEGNNVSISKGDVVSVVVPNLGEHGHDRMVLLADGSTRVVVPYAILGEGLDEQDIKSGPKGHEVMSMKGKLGGAIQGKAQGDEPTPEEKALKPIPGSRKASSIQGTYQGKGRPKDAPEAQMQGQIAPTTISGKTVEQVMDEVLSGLEKLSDVKAEALSETLIDEDDEIMYAVMHEAIYGDEKHTLDKLVELTDMMKAKKKKNKKDDEEEDGDEEGYTEEDIEEIFQVMKGTKKKQKK